MNQAFQRIVLAFVALPALALSAPAPAPTPKDITAPGESCSEAVVITDTGRNPGKGLNAERTWITQRYPGFTFVSQSLASSEDGRRFDIIQFKTVGGENKSVCFDITEFFAGGAYADKVRKRLSNAQLAPYIAALMDADTKRRADAIYRLSLVEPEAADAADAALISAMRDANFENVRSAIVAVTKRRPVDAASRLIELLASSDQEKAGIVAHELRSLGDAAKSAIPALEKLLSSTRNRTRSAAAQTLDSLGVRSARIVEVLEELLLRDTNMWVRQETAYALRDLEHLGASVIAMLEKAVGDNEKIVRQFACSSLKGFGTTAAKLAVERTQNACGLVG